MSLKELAAASKRLDDADEFARQRNHEIYVEYAKRLYKRGDLQRAYEELFKGLGDGAMYDPEAQLMMAKIEIQLGGPILAHRRLRYVADSPDMRSHAAEARKLLNEIGSLPPHATTSGSNLREYVLILVPVGEVDDRVLEVIKAEISAKFLIRVEIFERQLRPVSDSKSHWRLGPPSTQLDAPRELENLMAETTERRFSPEVIGTLGVTSYDLGTPGLNFVFGQSRPYYRTAIMSYARLYDREESPEMFERRITVQAVSSTLQIFGVSRPTIPDCPGAYPNSLAQLEEKDTVLCPETLMGLQHRVADIMLGMYLWQRLYNIHGIILR